METAVEKHELKISRVISADIESLFDAWLDVDSIREWMCPGETVRVPNPKLDARVGGKFDFTMQVSDELLPHVGEYQVIDRPTKLQFTWVSHHTHDQDSVVTINFEPLAENETRLTLVHTLLPDTISVENHTGGWTRIVETLADYMK